MNIVTVIAHPNPKSFCRALLRQFGAGLKEAGHANDIVDLCASTSISDPGPPDLDNLPPARG